MAYCKLANSEWRMLAPVLLSNANAGASVGAANPNQLLSAIRYKQYAMRYTPYAICYMLLAICGFAAAPLHLPLQRVALARGPEHGCCSACGFSAQAAGRGAAPGTEYRGFGGCRPPVSAASSLRLDGERRRVAAERGIRWDGAGAVAHVAGLYTRLAGVASNDDDCGGSRHRGNGYAGTDPQARQGSGDASLAAFAGLFLAIWLVVPLLLGGMLLSRDRTVFAETRYFIFLAPALCLAAGRALAWLWARQRMTALVLTAFAFGATVAALPSDWSPQNRREA